MINLKSLREERSLSQQKLADNFDISQQSIYKYENGISEPDIETLKRFAEFFHTSVDYIIGYTDNPSVIEGTYTVSYDTPTPRELNHLAMYRKLPNDVQVSYDKILKALVDNTADSGYTANKCAEK